jgi:hypothetical protein
MVCLNAVRLNEWEEIINFVLYLFHKTGFILNTTLSEHVPCVTGGSIIMLRYHGLHIVNVNWFHNGTRINKNGCKNLHTTAKASFGSD